MTIDSREVLSRPAPEPDATMAYGGLPDQVAEVRFPVGDGRPKAVVVFLHGGFWRDAYDRIHTRPLSVGLADAGYLVVTPEYRRTGAAGGGWPDTFADVAAAVAAVPALLTNLGVPVDVPIVVAGHSAGGQLALWVASAEAGRAYPAMAAVSLAGVVALAPVADLRAAHELDLDQGAVAALLGGGPDVY
ncbi:MAG TPA: alpha/beta hydrolase, partial [Micromonosporaceae bacterium]